MTKRADTLLERAKPVSFACPKAPLMGWSSWNTFACDISEGVIIDVARAMVTNGLKSAGYAYVNIDDGFFGGRDSDGRLRFHPGRFPNGMKGTVDGIHALGLKAGIYSDAGIDTCGSVWNGDDFGRGSGLYLNEESDCRLYFLELGFDFFKVDYCGGKSLGLDEFERYAKIANAIQATGRRDVRLNICRWAFPGTWAASLAGSWRTTRDIRASWDSVREIVRENLYLSAYVSPGHFNDLDMLEVGQPKGAVTSAFGASGDIGLTADEETTHFGMWCILSSPLVIGCDVRRMPESTMSLVTNPYLIAMNQDPLGLQAAVVARTGEAYVLVKDADVRYGVSRYVALYNATDDECDMVLKARDVDLGGRIDIFDLVLRADVGEFSESWGVRVKPHASRFFRLDAERRLDRIRYEAETAYLTDYSELDDPPYGNRRQAAVAPRKARPAEAEGASGGIAVVNLGGRKTNDLLWRDVGVTGTTRYRLVFRCRADALLSFQVQVDGGGGVTVRVSPTEGGFVDVTSDVILGKGVHAVRLSNSDGPMPDIDCMILRPLAVVLEEANE